MEDQSRTTIWSFQNLLQGINGLADRRRVACLALLSCALMAGMPKHAWGQGLPSVVGTVTDPSGHVIPGATVIWTDEATSVSTRLVTNAAGLYTDNAMQVGVYDVRVVMRGFRTYVVTHIALETGEVLRHDVTLQVGAVTQQVTVLGTPGAAALQRDTGNVSSVLDFQTVQDIPTTTRKSLELIQLTPGVTMTSPGTTQGQGLAFLSIAGNPNTRGTTYYMDGLSNNWPRAQGDQGDMSVTNPPVEVMDQMRVLTNSYSAEYGQGIGGAVLMTTKSGTNQWHGELYYFGQNDALNARNFFAVGVPPLHYGNYGGTIGGPIKKDRLFFFYNLERETNYASTPSVETLPTMAERAGDFSQLFNASGQQIPIYNPDTTQELPNGTYTRQQFPGNVIPSSQFDPIGANLLNKFIPPPNTTGTTTGANNFVRNREETEVSRIWNFARVDYDPDPTDRLYGRFSYDHPNYPEGGAWKGLGLAADADENDLYAIQRNKTEGFSWTKILSPTTINQFRFGRVSFYMHFEAEGDNPAVWNQNWAGKLGLSNLAITTFPYFAPSGYQGFGGSGADFGGRQELLYQTFRTDELSDNVNHLAGKHSLNFGVTYLNTRAVFDSRVWPSGESTYDPLMTALPGVPGTGNSIASLLLGQVGSAEVDDEPAPDVRTWYMASYLEDNWHARQNLTLNLGLRYEFDMPKVDLTESQNLFDFNTINPVCNCPGAIVFTRNLYTIDHQPVHWYNSQPLDFAPRLGFAWSPKGGKTVIRGGAAIFYAGIDNSDTMWDGPQAGLSTEGNWTENGLGTIPAFILSQGFPAAPSAPLNDSFGAVPIGQQPVFNPEFWVQDRPVTYSEQWNLGAERQLGGKTLLQVGYMGMVGRHLANEPMNYNQVPEDRMGPGNAQIRRPFPQFGNVDGFSANDESSLYHALLISVRRHYSNGLSLTANYTHSTLLSDYSYKRSDYNREADYGPDAVDVPNNFIFSSVYHLPFGGGPGARFLTGGVGSKILGGWLLGAMVPIQTALPRYFSTESNTCNCYTIGTQGVNIAGPLGYTPNFKVATDTWFETANISTPAPYTFGKAGALAVRGPDYWSVNLNLTRRFRITERYALEFRMDAFNLTNNVIFDGPNTTLGSPAFGLITGAYPGRILQYAAKLIF